MTEKLLPCPFCGSTATYAVARAPEGIVQHYTQCKECRVETPPFYAPELSNNFWNNRVPPPVEPTMQDRGYVPIADDGRTVFIDGIGDVELSYPTTYKPTEPVNDCALPADDETLIGEGRCWPFGDLRAALRAEPVTVPSNLYPPMLDRSKWTLREEITFNTPIDHEGGPDGNEARYIITAAQLDRLDQIESVLLASYGSKS